MKIGWQMNVVNMKGRRKMAEEVASVWRREEEEEEVTCHHRQLRWLLLHTDLRKCCINWAGLFIPASCVCARLVMSDRPSEVLTAVTVFFCIVVLCHGKCSDVSG